MGIKEEDTLRERERVIVRTLFNFIKLRSHTHTLSSKPVNVTVGERVSVALRMRDDEINYENISTIICCTNMNLQ